MIRKLISLAIALTCLTPPPAAAEALKRFAAPRGAKSMPLDAKRARDTILVRYKPTVSTAQAQETVVARHQLRTRRYIPGADVAVVEVPAGQTPEQAIATLMAAEADRLEYARIDPLVYSHLTPNDSLYPTQYHLPISGFPAAWDVTTGEGVIIAVADSGIKSIQNDLAAHIVAPAYNFGDGNSDVTDFEGHGTAVAGMAAAIGDNGFGVAGGAFNASILPLKITIGASDSASSSAVIQAIVYAADHGAKVVNVSFGSSFFCAADFWVEAARYMRSKGGLVTVSAGNDGHNLSCANHPEMIVVSATTSSDQLASFSNFGPDIDVAAPGDNVVTTLCSGCVIGGADYGSVDGTSFSAPLTASVAALIYSVYPGFTADQAQQVLFDSADDLGAPGFDQQFGHGRINAGRAVLLAAERAIVFQRETLANVYAYPNPWDSRRNYASEVKFANLPDGATVKLFTLSGFWIRTLSASNGQATWDLKNDQGSNAASGLYLYVITSNDGHKMKGRVALIR